MIRYLSKGGSDIGFIISHPTEEKAEYQEFSCRFETFGFSDNITGKAVGIDAIDALVNAMMRIDIFIKSSAECRSGSICWIGGSSDDDFGLPWQSARPR